MSKMVKLSRADWIQMGVDLGYFEKEAGGGSPESMLLSACNFLIKTMRPHFDFDSLTLKVDGLPEAETMELYNQIHSYIDKFNAKNSYRRRRSA